VTEHSLALKNNSSMTKIRIVQVKKDNQDKKGVLMALDEQC